MIDWQSLATALVGGGLIAAVLYTGRKLQILDGIEDFLKEYRADLAAAKLKLNEHETRITVMERGCERTHGTADG